MAEKLAYTIMEERKETMVPPSGGNPFLKTAYFLKPTSTNPPPLSPLSKAQIFDVRETSLQVVFRAHTGPQDRWKEWVYKLLPKYQNVWKCAGIYDSVLNSTFKIFRHTDLVLALAERWCVETNTFVFPWGESTITLEDMIVLGGYSILGDSVLSPLGSNEMIKIEEKLVKTRKNIELGTGRFVSHLLWMETFIDSNDELEHVAFLALWLARYVFCTGNNGVGTNVFPIAIHLSIGTRLAIAPAVLASIYRDLSLLKKSIVSFSSKGLSLKSGRDCGNLCIWAPIKWVQIWAWERFSTLRLSPSPIQVGEPRCARWHDTKEANLCNLRKVLDSAGEDFQWRPYCMVVNNWRFNEFYRTNGELVSVEWGMDEEIELFALCIRPSELVGFGGFVEQYQPHRVAMQFGLDQDIPGFVPRFNDSPDSAWEYFKRSIGDKTLYIPPRQFESDVTFQYFSWWEQKLSDKEGMIEFEGNVEKAKLKTMKRHPQASQRPKKNKKDCDSLYYEKLSISELIRCTTKTNVAQEGVVKEDKFLMSKSSESLLLLGLENGAREDVVMVADPLDGSSAVVDKSENLNILSSKVNNDGNEVPKKGERVTTGSDLDARVTRLEKRFAGPLARRFGSNV